MVDTARPPRPYPRGDVRRLVQPPFGSDISKDDTASDISELVYPAGYNPMCPTCSFLAAKYGPDDGELFIHCRNYYGNPDWLTDADHYIEGDGNPNPNLNYDSSSSSDANANYAAG